MSGVSMSGRDPRGLWHDKEGGTAIEYGLIAALIVVGLLVAINSIGTSTRGMYENLDSKLGGSGDGS